MEAMIRGGFCSKRLVAAILAAAFTAAFAYFGPMRVFAAEESLLGGRIASSSGEAKEFPLVPDSKSFGPPFAALYTAAVDDENQFVWASDFNSNRIYRFDRKTERTTEFFMPLPYEVRDLTADKTADRPRVWIPAYRPPSKLVKVQLH